MDKLKQLNVFYHGRKVGTMALYQNRLAAFEYDKEWLSDGFTISPFSLPLEKKVFLPKIDPFDGIFGIFSDSLPDGWGRLLVDRLMLKHHINPREVGNLNRLAIVGNSGMGALAYEPDIQFETENKNLDLDKIAEECQKILKTEESASLDELFQMGGSSGGARPKIFTEIDGENWIIKFPSREDSREIGKEEYDYAMCAKECGIEVEEVKLFSSNTCSGYFGTRRFDYQFVNGKKERVHMISVSALLETSHRIPNLDYELLMKLTLEITKDFSEVEKMYRRMCFNVFSHNRDDHSKNFSFLYKESEERYVLSPAYDMTYSNSLGGEHATTIYGNGSNPGMSDILAVAKSIGISEKKAKVIAEDIRECVTARLSRYLK